jgi:hypothetical protein
MEENLFHQFEQEEKRPVPIYLDIGMYDFPELIVAVHRLTRILEKKKYKYRFLTVLEGYNWKNWGNQLDHILTLFFPRRD